MILKNKWKEMGIFAALLFILALFLIIDIGANAETIKVGTVVNINTTLNFRSGPGTNYSIIGSLTNGQVGTILDEQKASDGDTWYKMQFAGMTGWAHEDYIEVSEQEIVEDKDFKAYLTAQGFPESYHAGLTALHNKYPNWKFEAQHTNLEWSTVIAEESKLGRNLTHTSNPASWKSTENGAYDWTTGTWYGFDSSSWVAASTEIVQYYMDPRNFFDESYVFQFIKQSYNPNDTTYEKNLTSMVQGSFLAGGFLDQGRNLSVNEMTAGVTNAKSYVKTLLEVASQSGVSPYTIATMIIQEQGRQGQGGCISGTEKGYEGYYNYFNVGAYEKDGLTPVQVGLRYASQSNASYGRPWNTRTKSMLGGAQYFGEGYIQKGQDTIYLKKFNVQGNNLFYHQYMTNIQGAASEGRILSNAYGTEARNSALVFKIPVYKNMPASPCVMPTGDGSPNNMLQSLSVGGQSLTPTFSMYESAYSVIVDYSVTSVNVSAKAYDSKATLTGTGTKNLVVGSNKMEIGVKAQNGTTRTYTITIQRKESEKPILPVEFTSTSYNINTSSKMISGIKTFPITASELEKGLQIKNGTMKILKADGSAQTGNVSTGNTVKIYDNGGVLKETYTIIIYGDVNGDGRVNAQDLLVIQKNNIRLSVLSGVNSKAADVNRDSRVNAQDLLLVQKHNIRIQEINQQ